MAFLDRMLSCFFTVNSKGFLLVASVLMVLETFVTFFIIKKVPYTEIDWSTYMQQVECFTSKKISNYSLIEGDTGPVVYPAGHLYIYQMFYVLTNKGKDIVTGQYIFMVLYLLNLFFVLRLYYKSNKIAPFVLPFLVITGYRIHSIFVLRMFNDPVAMLFFYIAANLFISQQWIFGCLLYSFEKDAYIHQYAVLIVDSSFAVSIKMNILLFAPALLFVLLLNIGLIRTIVNLFVCALVQLFLGQRFLLYDPIAYIKRSFDLGRVFMYKWTVNWRVLPEEVFLDKRLHLALLALHLVAVMAFGYHMWFRSHGGLRASLIELGHGIRTRTGVAETLFALFTANFIGITFSRSLHYQFYSWYYHQLPFLLFWNSSSADWSRINLMSIFLKVSILIGIEFCWNIYPSTVLSSSLLHFYHFAILGYLIITRIERYKRKVKAN